VIENELSDALWEQLFSARRSQRYHERRTTFFEQLHRLTDLTTIVVAGIVLMEFAGVDSPVYFKVLAALAALLSATDLVVGFSRRAEAHRESRRNFIQLEADILTGSPIEKITSTRLAIEKGEPSIYRALDVLCHNEVCIAMGYTDDLRLLPWFQRVTAHLCHWSNAGSEAKLIPTADRSLPP
jgi:hypothetical protein